MYNIKIKLDLYHKNKNAIFIPIPPVIQSLSWLNQACFLWLKDRKGELHSRICLKLHFFLNKNALWSQTSLIITIWHLVTYSLPSVPIFSYLQKCFYFSALINSILVILKPVSPTLISQSELSLTWNFCQHYNPTNQFIILLLPQKT